MSIEAGFLHWQKCSDSLGDGVEGEGFEIKSEFGAIIFIT